MSYARDCLTWDAKAHSTTRILNWALQAGPETRSPAAKDAVPGTCELISRSAKAQRTYDPILTSQRRLLPYSRRSKELRRLNGSGRGNDGIRVRA